MSRRILSALLVLTLVVGFFSFTQADVTGSFGVDINMTPMGKQTEAVKFFIDFQSNLQVNVTISGLTLGADLGFGVTGVEFAVLSLTTNLGALAVSDQFVFAGAFGCSTFDAADSNAAAIAGTCPNENTVAIGDGNGDGAIDNAVGFVKKRINLELNIAGITLSNLALFEDVDFPDITGTSGGVSDHEHDHFTSANPYFLNDTDTVVDNQTPTYGFGDVVSISGQTVSGITVSGETALCASGTNRIKKKSWSYEVNKACTAASASPIDLGAKTPLMFEQEKLNLSGIDFGGGVVVDVATTFKPGTPLSSTITAKFSVLNLADVTTTLSSTNITNLSLDSIVTNVSSGNLSLTLTDTGGDLQIDKTVAVLSTTLNANQNPASFTTTITTTKSSGITNASFALGVTRGTLSVDSTTTFGGTGNLAWSSTSFTVSAVSGDINFSAGLTYAQSGVSQTKLSGSVSF